MRISKYRVILIFILLIFWYLLTFKITEIPPGINGDEATLGYNAALLSKTMRDENGKFLPIFVSTHEGKDWKQPIALYSTALAFSIFDPSYFILRAVSVFYILLSSVLIFMIIKELLGYKFVIIGTLIFLTIPSVTIQSHLALENITPLPFIAFWLLMLIRYQKDQRLRYLLFSGISLGLSMYAYSAMRIIAPIFASLTILYLILLSGDFLKKGWVKSTLFFLLGVLPFILFFLVIREQYPGALGAHNRPSFPSSYQDFFLPYLSSYDVSFMFLRGDSTAYHSTGKHGIFLLASLPLFLVGIYHSIKKRELILLLVLTAFFTAPIFFGLAPQALHRGSRILAIIPLYAVIATVGLRFLFEIVTKKLRTLALILISILLLVNFLDFIFDYWFNYPNRVKVIFPSTTHITFKTFYEYSKGLDKKILIQKDIYENMGYEAKFFEKVYFPKGLQTWVVGDNLEPSSIILLSANNLSVAEKLGAREIETELTDPILVAKELQ